jgi:hypothetical protein
LITMPRRAASRRFVSEIAVVAAAVLAAADCSTNPPGMPTQATATLSGTVHVLGGTTLIPNVTVICQGKSAITNANGAFSIAELALGSTPVDLSAVGYKPQQITVDLKAGSNTFSIAIEPQ